MNILTMDYNAPIVLYNHSYKQDHNPNHNHNHYAIEYILSVFIIGDHVLYVHNVL